MNNTIYFNSPAKYFEEGALLGNGFLGATVYGGVNTERYSMNEATLWSGYPQPAPNSNGPDTFKRIQELILSGKAAEATEILEMGFSGINNQKYLPLCNLFIEHSVGEHISYSRTLDMAEGICRVNYSGADYSVERESFISNPDRVMAIKIRQNNVPITKIYLNSQLQSAITAFENGLILRGTAPVYVYEEGRIYKENENMPYYSENASEKGIRYKAMLNIECNGRLRFNGITAELLDATEITVYFGTRTSFNGFDKHPYLDGAEFENACMNDIANAASKSYEALKAAHIKDFSSLYNRTHFELGCSDTDKPVAELLKEHKSNALYELLFNFGKYLTVSGSREGGQPMNLQGIWNELVSPPWSSNYTLNINTEMNYSPTLRLNLPECFEPFVKLAEELAVTGRKIADEWYGIEGTVAHHNTDLWRIANPVGYKTPGNSSYSFFNTSLGWILLHLCEKYRLSGDTVYLKETLYPLLTEVVETFIRLLVEVDGEHLALSPATSPENRYVTADGKTVSLAVHSAINNSICRDTLKSAAELSRILGFEEAAERYEYYFEKIYPYEIGSDGRILEWDSEYKELEPEHRHISHLYGLHPAKEITPYKTPELAAAAAKSLNARKDDGTGWCIAWKANMWARLFDGNRALKLIDNQLSLVEATGDTTAIYVNAGGTYPNLLCAHPPFQIDGNFGAVSAIIEMLVQTNGNDIYILPALPDKWESGKITGIAIEGGAFIDIEWKNGKVSEVNIAPEEKSGCYNLIFKKQQP